MVVIQVVLSILVVASSVKLTKQVRTCVDVVHCGCVCWDEYVLRECACACADALPGWLTNASSFRISSLPPPLSLLHTL